MPQLIKIAALLAVLCLTSLTQAAAASPQADNGRGSPFGYERQKQKMMRPINDLLPQGSRDEGPQGRE
ncbi:hypothetical protein ABEH87_13400 [Erwinia sp. Eh17-17]|uniref:hypothetical protein n=1 Tax=Erwinia sp. Eh17-17 TaxID=3080330 RepID=UPI003207DD02